MSFSIAILKILSSYPDGQASPASLKADLAMLSTREWLARMRVLRARAGSINVFSDNYVTRGAYGWRITQAGRELLDRLECSEGIEDTEASRKLELRLVASKAAASQSRSMKEGLLKLVRSA